MNMVVKTSSDRPSGTLTQSTSDTLTLTTFGDELPPFCSNENQARVLAFIMAHGVVEDSRENIASSLKITKSSLARSLRKFQLAGVLKYGFKQLEDGRKVTRISVVNEKLSDSITVAPTQCAAQPVAGDVTKKSGFKEEEVESEGKTIWQDNIDENENLNPIESLLSLTNVRIRQFFPCLTNMGFGTTQIRQIVDAQKRVGGGCELIMRSMHYVEFELANMESDPKLGRDAKGQPYGLGYIFQGLSRNGEWRKPTGYLSPAEKELEERKAEMSKLLEVERELAAQKQLLAFMKWYNSLSESERANLKQQYMYSMQVKHNINSGDEKRSREAWMHIWREETSK